jgi:hypothetical protein
VFDAYVDGLMTKMILVRRNGQSSGGLSEPEAAVLSLLQKRLNRQPKPKAV